MANVSWCWIRGTGESVTKLSRRGGKRSSTRRISAGGGGLWRTLLVSEACSTRWPTLNETRAWYQETLGIGGEWGAMFPFKKDDPEGFTLLSPFKADTDYFGPSGKDFMVNLARRRSRRRDRGPGGQGHRNPRPAGRGLWPLRLDPRSRRPEGRTLAATRPCTGISEGKPCSEFETFAALARAGRPGRALQYLGRRAARWRWSKAGAKALATGSHPVGDASGFGDGQQVPLDFVLRQCRDGSSRRSTLPLTVDFEGAYSTDPEEGGRNVARLAGRPAPSAAISRTR